MNRFVNGVKIEITPEEIATMEKQARIYRIEESRRPFTADEVNQMMIAQQINTLTVDDNTALRMKEFYPTFESIIGREVDNGFKFTHGDRLWSVNQPKLTIQEHYPPGEGMESLYTEVCETHDGTLDDPIPYSGNMILYQGKYYIQDYVIYLCSRNTINPVYDPLSKLGDYVTAA